MPDPSLDTGKATRNGTDDVGATNRTNNANATDGTNGTDPAAGGDGDQDDGDGGATVVIIIVFVLVAIIACAVTVTVVTEHRHKKQTVAVLGSLAESRRETLAAKKPTSTSRRSRGRGGGKQTVHNATFDPGAANT